MSSPTRGSSNVPQTRGSMKGISTSLNQTALLATVVLLIPVLHIGATDINSPDNSSRSRALREAWTGLGAEAALAHRVLLQGAPAASVSKGQKTSASVPSPSLSGSISSPCCCVPSSSTATGQICCCDAAQACCAVKPVPKAICQRFNCSALVVGGVLAGILTLALCVTMTFRNNQVTYPAAGLRPFAGFRILPARRPPLRPVPVYLAPAEDEGKLRECPVCLEEITENAMWTTFPCRHSTCSACYQKILKGPLELSQCPLCRLALMEPLSGTAGKWEQVSTNGRVPGQGHRRELSTAPPAVGTDEIVVVQLPETSSPLSMAVGTSREGIAAQFSPHAGDRDLEQGL